MRMSLLPAFHWRGLAHSPFSNFLYLSARFTVWAAVMHVGGDSSKNPGQIPAIPGHFLT